MVKLKTNTPKIRKKILGSSPTIEEVEKIINDYFFSENYKVDKKDLLISNEKLSSEFIVKTNQTYQVIKQGQKYKFVFLW